MAQLQPANVPAITEPLAVSTATTCAPKIPVTERPGDVAADAHGLVRIASFGDVDAVADLSELISLCSQLRAEGAGGDGLLWAATAALLGHGLDEPRGALRLRGDAGPLEGAARAAAGDTAVDRALASHAGRVR